MRSSDATKYFSKALERSAGTVADHIAALQAHGLFAKGSRGRYGGVDLTETDAVNLLLALLLDRTRGTSIAEGVSALRALRLASTVYVPLGNLSENEAATHILNFVRDLAIIDGKNPAFGATFDALLRSMRSDRFVRWVESASDVAIVEIYDDGTSALLVLSKSADAERVGFSFGLKPDERTPDIQKIIRINLPFLLKLSTALGPLQNTS